MLFNALGRPDLNLKFNLFCAVVFPLCYLAAGLLWGMIGVCMVWMVLFPLAVMGLIHGTRHVSSVGLFDLLWSQRVILGCTAFMAAAVLALQWGLPESSRVTRLVLAIVVGVIAYSGPMLIFCRRTVLADLKKLWRE